MTTFLDACAPTPPPWQADIPDSQELPLLVTPAAHPDLALDGLSAETRELLAVGREGIEGWLADVAEHEAWMRSLTYVPDWAQPMRGER